MCSVTMSPGSGRKGLQMPYQQCPGCQLTVYSAAAYTTRDTCPRCDDSLATAPRRPVESRAASPDHAARAKLAGGSIRRALVGTGLFRDRSPTGV